MSLPVAFLTLSDRTGFYIYDELTFDPLRRLGWTVEEIAWDKPDVDWRKFAAVVIRSTWDYQQRPAQFLEVLNSITRQNVLLLNSAELVRWNIEKSYLRELEDQGIPIVPTEWRENLAAEESPDAFFENWETHQLVVKPLVGANADDTFCVNSGAPDVWETIKATFASWPCMVQPFIPSIQATGEYSLFYFGGEYSHCVLKTPKAGDFRVQEEHGGSVVTCEPPQELVAQCDRVVAALPELPLYARVDMVLSAGDAWQVIEVELIEPSLYFPYDEESPNRFAIALDQMLRHANENRP